MNVVSLLALPVMGFLVVLFVMAIMFIIRSADSSEKRD
jgi:hypothetical protein